MARLDPAKIPRHVAIIPDGNGRWAEARRLPREEGHQAGTEAVREVVRAAHELGVERHETRSGIGQGVAVTQAAADGAHEPDAGLCHFAEGFVQEWVVLTHIGGQFNVSMANRGVTFWRISDIGHRGRGAEN